MMMRRVAFAAAASTLFLLVALASSASAAIPFCLPGSGAGQCINPQGIAVDHETGRVYVADSGNDRINVFEADGKFVSAFGWGVANGGEEFQTCTVTCRAGIAGSGLGQVSNPQQIAVDNTVGSANRHAVYVMDGNRRLQKFDAEPGPVTPVWVSPVSPGDGACQIARSNDPIAVGPGGVVYAADLISSAGGFTNRILKFNPDTGACSGETVLKEDSSRELRIALAVDATENLFVTMEGGGIGAALRKYSPTGDFLDQLDESNVDGILTSTLSIDAAGSLFAAQWQLGLSAEFGGMVTQYTSGGAPSKRFGYGTVIVGILDVTAPGIGVFNGGVFANTGSDGIQFPALPADNRPVIVPEPCNVKAGTLGNVRATFRSFVNPEGKATTFHFEYVTAEHFDEKGFEEAAETPETPLALGTPPKDFVALEATTKVESLEPETVYHCRVVASNADGEATGVEGSFETKEALECGPAWTTDVDQNSALLGIELNPLGIATKGRFEYVSDADFKAGEFEKATLVPPDPEPEFDFGSGETLVAQSAEIEGLTPGTLYHFRLRATNSFFPEGIICPQDEEGEPSFRSFRTYAPEPDPPPDSRGYELVSPPQKNSAEVAVPGAAGGLLVDNYTLIRASASSGEAMTYTSWTSFANGEAAPGATQYLSRRGVSGWQTENLSPASFQGEPVIQLNPLYPVYRGFSPDLRFAGLVLGQAAASGKRINDLYLRDNAGGTLHRATPVEPEGPLEVCVDNVGIDYVGASADGSRVFFSANAAYPGTGAVPGAGFHLYEWSQAGGLKLVSVLPSGNPATATERNAFGTENRHCSMAAKATRDVISADGKRAFWTYALDPTKKEREENKKPASQLFARVEGAVTVQLDKKVSGGGLSGKGVFLGASTDGSNVFFTSENKLLTGAGVDDLYLYDFSSPGKELKDLTPGGAGVKGMVGVSDDGSHAYFVAGSVLTEEENAAGQSAQAGANNLYHYELGEGISLVAVLSTEDSLAWAGPPATQTARVSPDGGHLAFLSTEAEELAKYDNAIAGGEHCQLSKGEQPLQGSPLCPQAFLYDAGDGSIYCASCNPSLSRPLGPSSLPGWTNPLEGPRFLSDDGSRVFFETFDALVPADENGKRDVYEFEFSGNGSCSSGSPSFDPAAGGCRFLVSTGKSEDESRLLDASTDGRDVFFATRQRLVGWDKNGNYDVYDLRVGGGFPEPVPPPVCEGEGCKAPPQPAPAAPAAATPGLFGPGNVKPKKEKKGKKAHKKGKKHKSKKKTSKKGGR